MNGNNVERVFDAISVVVPYGLSAKKGEAAKGLAALPREPERGNRFPQIVWELARLFDAAEDFLVAFHDATEVLPEAVFV